MDHGRVFTAAVSRTVSRCLMEELPVPTDDTSPRQPINPLLPPACVPFLELIGLEAVVDQVISKMNSRKSKSEDSDSDELDEDEKNKPRKIEESCVAEPFECSNCGRDFSPGWWEFEGGIICFKCTHLLSKIPLVEKNQLLSTKVVERVAIEVAEMERAQIKRVTEIEERKKRKSQIKTYLKECKSTNVLYPSIIGNLTQNSLSDEKKRELISVAANHILARLRGESFATYAKPPPLDTTIETMDDLLKFC